MRHQGASSNREAGRRWFRDILYVSKDVVPSVEQLLDDRAELGRSIGEPFARQGIAPIESLAVASPHRLYESLGVERHPKADRLAQPPEHAHHRGEVIVIERADRTCAQND